MRKILIISLLFLSVLLRRDVFGADIQEIQNQINNTNIQIQNLDKEIKMYQDQISATNQKSNSLSNIIKELTLTRNKLLKEKEQTEKKIKNASSTIVVLDRNIKDKEHSIYNSKISIAKIINDLYQNETRSLLERIVVYEDFNEMSREYNDRVSINKNLKDNINTLSKEKVSLNNTKDEKEIEKTSLTMLKNNLTQKEISILNTKKEQDTLLKETKNQESNYKAILAERQKQRDAFEKSLEKYESELKFILNPKLLPKEGSGVLSWPLEKVYITQLFGKTVAARRLYTSGSHSGVDFRASIGTPVMSMGDGVVVGTGDTDLYCKGASFGKWVFIKYNNGLSSTFGHLSSISSTAGQIVKTGDVVGLSGNTGHSTGPHLHVTVYASDGADVKTVPSLSCSGKTFIMPIASREAYLDPILYLPKVLADMLKNDSPRD